MAYREVEPDPYVPKSFAKLSKVGDYIEGFYVSSEEGQYGLDMVFEAARGKTDGGTAFKDGPGVLRVLTVNKTLRKQLEKDFPAAGNKVFAGKKGEKDIGKENPMGLYRVRVDPDAKPPKPAEATGADDFGDENPF